MDAIGIGCRRCASSFLHNCLNNHQDVVKPHRGLHYFSQHFEKGRAWYVDQLPNKNGTMISLEYSVSYSYPEYATRAAQRISQQFPDVKIFVAVRNPIDRAFSDYLRSIRHCEIPANLSFEQAIEISPVFLERGKYQAILSPYYDLFPSKKIYILFFDDLELSVNEYLRPFYKFLGIRDNLNIASIQQQKPIEGGRTLRWEGGQYVMLRLKSLMDDGAKVINSEKAWGIIKEKFIRPYQYLRGLNTKDVKIKKETRLELLAYYASDIDWLSRVSGRDFEGWKR